MSVYGLLIIALFTTTHSFCSLHHSRLRIFNNSKPSIFRFSLIVAAVFTMRFQDLLKLVALISVASASAIPTAAPTAVPTTVFSALTIPTTTATATQQQLPHRAPSALQPAQTVFCGCGRNLDAGNTNDAVGGLVNLFDSISQRIVPPYTMMLVHIGSVVAFACNLGNAQESMPGSQYLNIMRQPVSRMCGRGTWQDHTLLTVGYMQYSGQSGQQICDAAASSRRRSGETCGAQVDEVCPYLC
jgi:hypothetical protein